MREQQRTVGSFAKAHGLGQDPQARMLDFVSEVGELSKELLKASGYGERPVTPTASMEEELGDCVFSLLCLSDSLEIDAQQALELVLEKYRRRFSQTGQIGSSAL